MNPAKKTSLKKTTRILSAVCGVAFLLVVFVPIWKIELTAPQYPEGLEMFIYSNKLGGEVNIINGLNHYIGMRELHADDFVEFTVLPYLIATIALFGIITAVVNRKWFFYVWAGIFVLFAILSMVDFYAWLYNYGHNLDSEAPLQMPGMTYQPPLLGYKQLLNFGAYSIPALGGWIMAGVGGVIAFLFFVEVKNVRAIK